MNSFQGVDPGWGQGGVAATAPAAAASGTLGRSRGGGGSVTPPYGVSYS